MVGAQRLSDYGRTLDAVEPSVAVDTYNVTSLLAQGGAIAIEAYYRSNPDPESADPSDRGGVVAILQTESEYPNASSSSEVWKAFDATPAFNPDLGPRGEGAGTGSYAQPHEDIDMRRYPQGWRDVGFDDSRWARPSAWAGEWDHTRAYHVPGWPPIAPKEALPVSLRTIPAASFEMLSQTTDEAGADSYHYIIDFGKNFQGHVNISFGSGRAGQKVNVSLGEQRTATAVRSHAESNNVWLDTWTLAHGENQFVPHEYAEFRCEPPTTIPAAWPAWLLQQRFCQHLARTGAEVKGAPEPPTHARVCGWQVHYPFDAELNEHGLVIQPPLNTEDAPEIPGLTMFNSSSADLDSVWALVRHTINAAAIDLNTDSNTRQRDLCTLDAWLATRYQGGVAPGTAYHLRKRVVQNMYLLRQTFLVLLSPFRSTDFSGLRRYEPNGFVNWWTEFLIAHVGALRDFTIEYSDHSLASTLWDQGPVSMGLKSLGMENYSLAAYFDESDSLVHNTPKPLVDWPRTDGLDTNAQASTHCKKLCAQMNAYAVRAQEWLSEIASRADWDYDRSRPIELARKASEALAKRAVAIRGATEKTFAASGASCVTSGSPDDNVDAAELRCYTDQPLNDPESTPFTSATATSLAAFASVPGSAGVLQLVPFLKARNGRRGPGHGMETSGWMTGFMLEGLYAAAGDLELEGGDTTAVVAAVDYAHSTLTNQGNNSWLGMIRQNATMTMESWTQPPFEAEGGGTFSHPWTAAPAWIIPRFLMGVRPLQDGWRRVAIRPLPGRQLSRAAIKVPTQRGSIELAFDVQPKAFAATITIPGNTFAEVCLPLYLFAGSACTVQVGGTEVGASKKGALMCLDEDLGGGAHAVRMACGK